MKKVELGPFTALNNEGECGRIGCKLRVVLEGYWKGIAMSWLVTRLSSPGTRARDPHGIHRYFVQQHHILLGFEKYRCISAN